MTLAKLPSPARRAGLAGAAVAAIAVLAACGSVAAPGSSSAGASGSSSGGGATAPAAAPKASLTITVENGPGRAISHWTLTCDPVGGTHPDAAAACHQLLALKNPFAPVKTGTECPMILASAKEATFTGTWYGQKVNSVIKDGGCDLGKWSQLNQVMN
jgi:hypothetical protein